ncbi:glutamate transport system permease protein [Nocardiopsis mwathae]|uniref:Glutamate transport system permease protein n=1 Tax=Nocardiopsis mwathae TaxID=1472723 RepID=A0A7W9YEU1_9ACTN|nr:glutamate transport system permease protein [Nocardiopsis mwathae]
MSILGQQQAGVLFDAPGPRARARQRLYSVLAFVLAIGVAAFVYLGFNKTWEDVLDAPGSLFTAEVWQVDEAGQWSAEKWEPFLDPAIWTDMVLPGMMNTLHAAAVAAVLAIVFGIVFGVGRLSEHWWIRAFCGAVVEFFRAIPLLILIFFTLATPLAANQLLGVPFGTFQVSPLTAVIVGLTLYNGSVLAEVFRAGINAVPRGQAEAAYSLGMNKTQVMTFILIPQAVTSMMPAIVAQLVVLLKDSALGYIVAFPELLRGFSLIGTRFNNVIPAAIVCAAIYIIINLALGRLAVWLERRNAQRGKATAKPATAPGVQDVGPADRTGAAAEPRGRGEPGGPSGPPTPPAR